MKAMLKNYRQSPRKVRLVADAIRGKKVSQAFVVLHGLDKKASGPMSKLLHSAVQNAQSKGKDMESLTVESITVNQGITMKRYRPRARGRTSLLRKRTSTIQVILT